jgi:hypothetical protein
MRCVYSDYADLRRQYGHIIKPLANSLKSQADDFYYQTIGGYAISAIVNLPNEILIDDVVLNAMSDLDRVMAYHPVDTPTLYKYAAYIGFWWQRSKPISCKLHEYTTIPAKKLQDPLFIDLCLSVNELFITEVMLSFIQKPLTGSPCIEQGNTFSYADMQDSLQYFLRYRHYTAQELELFLKGLNTCPLVR